ncbi:hypothetical protein [Stenotrophomonas maltophilia]|uniref:hypothetical protein n=1 Tax=Stenotrophomonas maltophilia TaxID=40324 RepID=UPI00166089A0|nr:hypothetical protein [Stenotrophomonas maltophilia]
MPKDAQVAVKKSAAKRAVKKAAPKKKPKEILFKGLDKPPTSSDFYLWCDYIEVRCLASPDKRFSRGDLLECTTELGEMEILTEGVEPEDEEYEGDETVEDAEDVVAEDNGLEADDEALRALPVDDRREARAADLYSQFAVRSQVFGDAYPFSLSEDGQEISLLENRTASQNLYLELLLSSSLRLISLGRWGELTERFEEISEKIFRGLMPPTWQVHRFGAKGGTRYRGHLHSRLKALAKDWRADFNLTRKQFKARNSGDGGLDLVAWHPMGEDGRVGVPAAAAQCGCTAEGWSLKQLEASPANMSFMRMDHPWATYYFMPLDLVAVADQGFDWQRRPHLSSTILVDRLRIVRLSNEFKVMEHYKDPSDALKEAPGSYRA